MGRHRGTKKFSFPLPRRPRLSADDDRSADDDGRSTPSISIREWPASAHQDSATSKAHRVLGTSAAAYSPVPHQLSVPPSPGYMSIAPSEASFGSRADDRPSTQATDISVFPKQPTMSKRSSSTILGRMYSRDGRGSDNSSVSHRLQPQTSNSTMRSHYDAKNSPLSISQQTSDSAVRDRALRRGHPSVLSEYTYAGRTASETKSKAKESRKGKPSRLDLSKLFPTPKLGDDHTQASLLLSPTKMVNSPAPLSTTSEYFPRPMTRAPTPTGGQVKLRPSAHYQHSTLTTPTSPVRLFKRDEYDNAKVHIRRPPKGIQHWFDALDDDTDESSDDADTHLYAPQAVRAGKGPKIPVRKTSLSRMLPDKYDSHHVSTSHYLAPTSRSDMFAHEDLVEMSRLNSPSQFSVNSLVSTRTKESSLMSKSNLQDSSVLSFSSSEDEHDYSQAQSHEFLVRKSLELPDDAGDIIIGQAQAFEVRPNRRPSVGRVSTRSTSTSAATIEVMYTPEPPFSPCNLPNRSNLSIGRRSCHTRQPSVIPEDEDFRPQTSANMGVSSSSQSVRSARTSASEPKLRSSSAHKLMAVTAEEEALLEMMRKKRAAMAKQGLLDTDPMLCSSEDDKQPKTPPEATPKKYRTSGFLSMEQSPVRGAEPKRSRRAVPPSPLVLSPRGRQPRATQDGESEPSKSCDGSPATRTILPHHLPTPGEFSPLDPFPAPASPTPPVSVTSPTTTDQPSSLPSPVTPGLRIGESDLAVKVASSDTSNDSEEVSILDNGVIDALSDRNKPDSPSHELSSQHQRRRTASSAANIACPTPELKSLKDFTSFSETSSRPPSHIESPYSKLQRRNSRRRSGLTLTTNNSRSSIYSHSSIHAHGIEKRSSRGSSRGNSIASMRNPRNSVSEDVLAAWNSLGGTY